MAPTTQKLVSIIVVFLCIYSCNRRGNHWTEQERKDYKCKCEQTETFKYLSISLWGFQNQEFDSVLVKGYRQNVIVDSFKFFVFPSQDDWEKEHIVRRGSINRLMHTEYVYHFVVPGQSPYVLSNMKMEMSPRFTNGGEAYSCDMADYDLDGVKFIHNDDLHIEKRN